MPSRPQVVDHRNLEFSRSCSQSAVVGVFLIFPCCMLLLCSIYLCFPYGWLVLTVWVGWIGVYDRVAFSGAGRPILAIRRCKIGGAIRDYHGAKLVQEEPLDPSETYIFAAHPHGVYGAGVWINFVMDSTGLSRKNRNLDVAVATVNLNFYIPIWRDILLALGFVDASTLQKATQRGRSIAIVIGGAAEALDSHPGYNGLTLKKRRGFIRLALATGSSIVPVYSFGETDMYDQYPNPRGSFVRRVQNKLLETMKFSLPLVRGTGLFGIPFGVLPYETALITVVGKPIAIPRIENATRQQIDFYHEKYMTALTELFDRYKHDYAPHRKADLCFLD